MRCVVQRVRGADVKVADETTGKIERGLLVLLGIGANDDEQDLRWMVEKIVGLRIFEDRDGKMNRSVVDVGGEMLVVSQFTLYGDCRRGKRPSFTEAMQPDRARGMVDSFCRMASRVVRKVETGRFGATMAVSSCNEGPVTLVIDSEKTIKPKS